MERFIPGTEVDTTYGKAFHVSGGCSDSKLDWETLHNRFRGVFQDKDTAFRRKIEKICQGTLVLSEDILFVDIETTGLTYTPLFLIGCLTCTDSDFVLSQFLARDLTEEKAVIYLFLEYIEGKRLIVSFNGTSFDLPYIEKRAFVNDLSFNSSIPHLDLLRECRMLWRNFLPDFTLATIEKYICNRVRYDDIRGSKIPSMYLRFLETKDPHYIGQIIKHNALDLLSMTEIAVRIPRFK